MQCWKGSRNGAGNHWFKVMGFFHSLTALANSIKLNKNKNLCKNKKHSKKGYLCLSAYWSPAHEVQ